MPKDYLEAGRAELAIEAVSFIVLGLTYMAVLPQADKIFAMLSCVFFMTLGVYGFNQVTDRHEDSVNKPNSAIISGRKSARNILVFSLACKLVALVSAFLISLPVFAIVCVIILCSFFYSQRSIGGGRLKDMFLIKNIIISLLWALLPLLPMLALGVTVPPAFLIVIFFVFISSLINTVTSDLKDVSGDKAARIKTFPTVYGVKTTLATLAVLNTIELLALAAGWMFMNLSTYLFLLPMICLSRCYGFWLISSKKKSVSYVYGKLDCPAEIAIGPLALLGRLFVR